MATRAVKETARFRMVAAIEEKTDVAGLEEKSVKQLRAEARRLWSEAAAVRTAMRQNQNIEPAARFKRPNLDTNGSVTLLNSASGERTTGSVTCRTTTETLEEKVT